MIMIGIFVSYISWHG